jgi:hypothetical protein
VWKLPPSGWTVRGSDPGEGEIFASVRNGPEAHPVSYTMSTGSFPRVKWQCRGVDHPLTPSAEVNERVELYISRLGLCDFLQGEHYCICGNVRLLTFKKRTSYI